MVQGAAFRLLACFYNTDERGFAELCQLAGYPTDLGGYYLRQLVSAKYVEKIDRGRYQILPKGRQELALRYGKELTRTWPRLHAVIVARQTDSAILLRRTVQPFMGAAEWVATAVKAGEEIQVAADRVAASRISEDSARPSFVGFFRRIDLHKDTVFDDKLFAIHTLEMPEGASLKTTTSVGEIVLCKLDQIKDIAHPSRALLDIFAYATTGGPLVERTYQLAADDFALARSSRTTD